jgi:hypothetical protein
MRRAIDGLSREEQEVATRLLRTLGQHAAALAPGGDASEAAATAAAGEAAD